MVPGQHLYPISRDVFLLSIGMNHIFFSCGPVFLNSSSSPHNYPFSVFYIKSIRNQSVDVDDQVERDCLLRCGVWYHFSFLIFFSYKVWHAWVQLQSILSMFITFQYRYGYLLYVIHIFNEQDSTTSFLLLMFIWEKNRSYIYILKRRSKL